MLDSRLPTPDSLLLPPGSCARAEARAASTKSCYEPALLDCSLNLASSAPNHSALLTSGWSPHLTRYGLPLALLSEAASLMNASAVGTRFRSSRYSYFAVRWLTARGAWYQVPLRLNWHPDAARWPIRWSISCLATASDSAANAEDDIASIKHIRICFISTPWTIGPRRPTRLPRRKTQPRQGREVTQHFTARSATSVATCPAHRSGSNLPANLHRT